MPNKCTLQKLSLVLHCHPLVKYIAKSRLPPEDAKDAKDSKDAKDAKDAKDSKDVRGAEDSNTQAKVEAGVGLSPHLVHV